MQTRRTLLLTAIVAVAAAAAPATQSPPRPVFRVGSDLVVVDLLPTGPDGKFVADLQPSDVTVLQDGRPQKIQFMQLLRQTRRAAAPAAPAAPAPAMSPEAGEMDAAASAPVSLAIVIDLQATPPDALSFVKRAVEDMVTTELPAGSQVMLATLADGLTIQQPFTADAAVLRKSLETVRPAAGDAIGFSQIVDAADHLCDVAGSSVDRTPALQQTIGMARVLIAEGQKNLRAAADTLGGLATTMGRLDGRKHLVLYSAGYALNPLHAVLDVVAAVNASCAGTDPDQMRRLVAQELASSSEFDAATPLQQMVDRAHRAQVAVYAVDSRGLLPGNVQARQRGSARMTRSAQLQRIVQLETSLPQEFLRVVARDTGGRSFLNTNDLARGIRSAWADASEYYLIGYTPSGSPKKGTFHRIEVKVARPGLDLRHRAGYYEATEAEIARRDVEHALRAPLTFGHTGLEIDSKLEGKKLRVTAFIPPDAVAFTPKNDTNVGEISVHATLHDSDGKVVGGKALFSRDITLRFNAGQIEQMRQSDNIEFPVELDAPKPGTYLLTVVGRASGGWIGAKRMAVAVSGS